MLHMQRQREPSNKPHRRARRSVGELLLCWLFLLWGAGLGIWIISVRRYYPDLVFPSIFLLHSLSSVLAGLAGLLRVRKLASQLFYLIGLTLILFGGWAGLLCWSGENSDRIAAVIWASSFTVVATLVCLLGRWIGRQEDEEAP